MGRKGVILASLEIGTNVPFPRTSPKLFLSLNFIQNILQLCSPKLSVLSCVSPPPPPGLHYYQFVYVFILFI